MQVGVEWGGGGGNGVGINHGIKKLSPLSTLRSDEGTFPRDGHGVVRHATPAAGEHFAVVQVTSEGPPRSHSLARISLRTVDLEC